MLKEEKDNLMFFTESAASYLLSLFYKSGKIYSTGRPKINKMLIIHSLCNKKYPELLDSLYINGEGIYNILYYYVLVVYKDTYILCETKDDNLPYTGNFDSDIEVPRRFIRNMDYYPLDDYTKNLLEDIFRTFASSKQGDLISQTNEISVLVKRNKDSIDFITDNKYMDNKVYNYVNEHLNKSKILMKKI